MKKRNLFVAIAALIFGCAIANAKTIKVYGQGDALLGTYANVTSVSFADGILKFVSGSGIQSHSMSDVSYFTLGKDATTGIEEVFSDETYSVRISGGNLVVSGTSPIGDVRVYSSIGYLLASYNTSESNASFALPECSGMLIVAISGNQQVVKIVK